MLKNFLFKKSTKTFQFKKREYRVAEFEFLMLKM